MNYSLIYPDGELTSRKNLLDAAYVNEKILDNSDIRNVRGAWHTAAVKLNIQIKTTIHPNGMIITRLT